LAKQNTSPAQVSKLAGVRLCGESTMRILVCLSYRFLEMNNSFRMWQSALNIFPANFMSLEGDCQAKLETAL